MRSTTLADLAIRWYGVSARDLPWRRPGTSAWGVLVSEVMLQQTQVARVVPIWGQWLRRWPTPAALAAAGAGEAVRAWGRLGYPRRALRLHACAAAIVACHGGEVPDDLSRLLALPGVGAYTARAVAAFAHGQRHAVVDTNVRRLIARAADGRAGGGQAVTAAELATVDALLPPEPRRAARASVAFMELGALVCLPRSPVCEACPLSTVCAWRAAGYPDAPLAPRRPPQRYAGSERQVRGLLLGLVRDHDAPVPACAVEALWPDGELRGRALAGLLADGLLVEVEPGWYGLPR
jgi:A/G-specific adenine glycosylase